MFFVGFRYNSVDYELYSRIFESQSFNNFDFPFYSDGLGAREFLFSSLISIFKNLNINYQMFILTFTLISIPIKIFYIKKYSPYVVLSLFLYFAFLFSKDMGQFRNATIAAILLIAIIPLVKREFVTYFGIILISSGIHSFSIVAIPLYFIYPFLTKTNITKLLLIISLFIFIKGGLFSHVYPFVDIFGNTIKDKLIGYYLIREFELTRFNIFNLSLLLFSILFILFKDTFIKKNTFEDGLYSSFMYGLLLYFMFPDIGTVGARSLNYLSAMPLAILIPVFINQIKIRKLKYISYVAIVVYCMVLFYPTIKSMHIYQNYLFY